MDTLKNIDFIQYYPSSSRFILKWKDSTALRQVDDADVPKEDLSSLSVKLSTLRTVEQRELDLAKEAKKAADKEALFARDEAERAKEETARVRQDLEEATKKIAALLTGDPDKAFSTEMIRQYPEWQEGLSVDAGDAYRVGDVLYMAIRGHVTSKDNSPESQAAKDYWKGGNIKDEVPPVPGFKYPKNTVKNYMGVDYYACVDTNNGPEVGYPTWDLLDNKPL